MTNPQAVRAILAIKTGDRVFIYHSGGVSAIVGMAAVRSDGRPDPKNPKSAIVDLAFALKLEHPLTLAKIKRRPGSSTIGRWCVRKRLSTMEVPDKFRRVVP